jgi:glutaredoxin
MKTVTIYSTPSCHFCHLAKDYFNEQGIQFTDYNIAEDMEKRKDMFKLKIK